MLNPIYKFFSRLFKQIWNKLRGYQPPDEEPTQQNQEIPPFIPYTQLLRNSELLDEGAAGGVYLTRYMNRELVYKIPLRPKVNSFIEHENTLLSQSNFKHPNIVVYLASTIYDSVRCPVMEYVSRTDLNKYRDERRNSNLQKTPQFYEIFIKLTQALICIHSQRVLHRDVKPLNILVTRQGEPVLIDFDLAVLMNQNEEYYNDPYLRGSPGYLAPECFPRGTSPAQHSFASDLYALAVTLAIVYLNDPLYFVTSCPFALYDDADPFLPPPPLGSFDHEPTRALLAQLWDKKPKERPTDAQMLETLTQIKNEVGASVAMI